MASRGSYIRSAARATFSAYRCDPDPLAAGRRLGVADLRNPRELRGDRRRAHRRAAPRAVQRRRAQQLRPAGKGPASEMARRRRLLNCKKQNISLKDYTSAEHAQIRIFNEAGVLLCTQEDVKVKGVKALRPRPSSGSDQGRDLRRGRLPGRRAAAERAAQHRVAALRPAPVRRRSHRRARPGDPAPRVLGGTVLALLGGLATAARAMRPIVQLTEASREIERTRDPRSACPIPRPTTRSRSSPGPSRGCCYRSTPRAPIPMRRSNASGSSSPTPRTSCARR